MGNSASTSSSFDEGQQKHGEPKPSKGQNQQDSTGRTYKTIQDAIVEASVPVTSTGRRVAVARTDSKIATTINTHKESPLKRGQAIPSSLTAEQAEVLAEIDPLALKAAVDMDSKKKRMRYMVIDTFEIDATWALIAAGLVGIIAVPVTKYAVDNTEVNRVYYQETAATRTHSVYTVTPRKEKPKPNPVAGNTFQSIVASGKNLPIAHALEKIRAQQLRLGFFSIWRGTGAELIWFLTSCSSALALQSFADRIWNREWYNALARYKKQQRIVKRKDDLEKSGAEPTEEDKQLLAAAELSFVEQPFVDMLPAGANMKLCPDHRWNHWYLTKRAFVENTATGAVGGFLSVLTTYHAEIVATKCVEDYQNALKRGSKRQFNGMMDCYIKTHQQHGLASLYFGVGPVFLRSASFWGLTFGFRGAVTGLWGLLAPNDYVRMMKRQHFDLPAESANAKEAAAALQQNMSTFKAFASSKSMKYSGEEYSVMPILFDFAVTTGSAALARDVGAVAVKQMVFGKSALQHLFAMSYAKMRNNATLQSGEGAGLLRGAIEFGRSTASTCPRRLPFSCLRIGVVVSVFDAFRAGHARRWCTRVREDEMEAKFGMSPRKMKAKEDAAAKAAAEAEAEAKNGGRKQFSVSFWAGSA